MTVARPEAVSLGTGEQKLATLKEYKMKLIKSLLVAAALAFVAVPHSAFAGDAEKKCDAHGKECKDGKDCKPEHCKKEEPK